MSKNVKSHFFDSEADSEKLATEIIGFCKKWGLWQDVCIYTGGKCYTDLINDDENYLYINPEKDVYVREECNPDRFLTGYTDVGTYEEPRNEERCFANPEHLLDMTYEGPLYMLLRYHEYEVRIDTLPDETKKFLEIYDDSIRDNIEAEAYCMAYDYMENKEGWDPVEFDSYEEYLKLQDEIEYDKDIFNCKRRDFASMEEYEEFLEKALASKEATLEEYFMDKAENLVMEDMEFSNGGIYYNNSDIEYKIIQEFDALLEKYGLWYELGFSWNLTTYRIHEA